MNEAISVGATITDEMVAKVRASIGKEEVVKGWYNDEATRDTIRHYALGIGDLNPLCLDVEERFTAPHLNARENFVFVEHPILGNEPLYGIPYKLSKTPGQVQRRAPLMGEHNYRVFCQLLGLSPSKVKQLEEEKVIF